MNTATARQNDAPRDAQTRPDEPDGLDTPIASIRRLHGDLGRRRKHPWSDTSDQGCERRTFGGTYRGPCTPQFRGEAAAGPRRDLEVGRPGAAATAHRPRLRQTDPARPAAPVLHRRSARRVDRVTFPRIASRAMSHPSDSERRQLDEIAVALREISSERGYRVDVALETDPAFGSGRSRSSLMRDLVIDTVESTASQISFTFRPVNGAGRELVGAHHRYRVLRAKRDAGGNLIVLVASGSSIGVEEEPNLFPLESWVFGWRSDDTGTLIIEVFVAEILRVEPGRPGRLVLGSVVPLGADGPFGGGFTPTEEDLDLGDEDDDLGEIGA